VHKLDNKIFKQFLFHRKHTACPSKLISLSEIIYAYKMYNSERDAVNSGRYFRMLVKPFANFKVSEYKVILP